MTARASVDALVRFAEVAPAAATPAEAAALWTDWRLSYRCHRPDEIENVWASFDAQADNLIARVAFLEGEAA